MPQGKCCWVLVFLTTTVGCWACTSLKVASVSSVISMLFIVYRLPQLSMSNVRSLFGGRQIHRGASGGGAANEEEEEEEQEEEEEEQEEEEEEHEEGEEEQEEEEEEQEEEEEANLGKRCPISTSTDQLVVPQHATVCVRDPDVI
jgi:Sec-independent protein translocase protein TatA